MIRFSFRNIIFLSLLFFSFWTFWPGSGKKWENILVSQGSNAHRVADSLLEKKLIRSRYSFLFWIKVRKAEHKIPVGLYRFSLGRSSYWLVDDLINGRTQKVKLVIPEGFSSWQIAERVKDLQICDPEEFIKIVKDKKLEGFLTPATYEFDLGLSADSVIQQLVQQFKRKWTPEMEARAKEWGWDQHQTVTFASIIEREVMDREELPLVASVYHNRLKKKMKLEADPTVQYALGYWKSRLTFSDYRNTQSPYNTYLVAGLPPGPISNPGFDAIQASLWPDQTDYLYFVALEGGRHTFSKTYHEHVNNVNKRNRLRRQKS
jgi:UPF0755 protein